MDNSSKDEGNGKGDLLCVLTSVGVQTDDEIIFFARAAPAPQISVLTLENKLQADEVVAQKAKISQLESALRDEQHPYNWEIYYVPHLEHNSIRRGGD